MGLIFISSSVQQLYVRSAVKISFEKHWTSINPKVLFLIVIIVHGLTIGSFVQKHIGKSDVTIWNIFNIPNDVALHASEIFHTHTMEDFTEDTFNVMLKLGTF